MVTGVQTIAYKTSDTNRTTTSVISDPELTVTISANTDYILSGLIRASYTTISSFNQSPRFSWAVPGTPTEALYSLFFIENGAAAQVGPAFAGTTDSVYLMSSTTSYSRGNPTNIFNEGRLYGVIRGSATSGGTLALQWGQSSASADPATVFAGSYFILTEV